MFDGAGKVPTYLNRESGGKSNITDWILDQFSNDYRRYVKVFGGAASVLYRKGSSPEEAYNDLNTGITVFFETLRDRPD